MLKNAYLLAKLTMGDVAILFLKFTMGDVASRSLLSNKAGGSFRSKWLIQTEDEEKSRKRVLAPRSRDRGSRSLKASLRLRSRWSMAPCGPKNPVEVCERA